MSYIVKLAESLTDINFDMVSGLTDSQNITEFCRFMTFAKHQGHMVYGICVLNCDAETNYEKVSEAVSKSFAALSGNKIFLVIALSSKPDDRLMDWCHNDIDDYGAEFVTVKWLADIENESIVVKGSQPDEILDIRQAVLSAFGKTEKIGSVSLSELNIRAEKNRNEYIEAKIPYSTYILFVINTIFWLIMYIPWGSSLIDNMALNKELVSQGQIYRLFTYMFTHGGILHYLCNNFSLMIIGSRAEKYMGNIKFMIIYLLSGIFAGVVSYVVIPYGICVGASGAIFGVVGLLICLTWKLRQNVGGFDFYLAAIYALVSVAGGFMIENVDNFAHIGGLLGGVLFSALLMTGSKKKKV